MTLVATLAVLAVAVAVTPWLTRVLGRDTGYPLAVGYLVATAAFWPAVTAVMAGEEAAWSVTWVAELDVNLALRADGIGVLFTLIALVIGAVVFLYSTRYLAPGRQTSFYLVMATFTLSMVGLALADDLILLFLCWELTSLASFLLIARSGHSGEAASMRTLLLTFVGGLTLLAAVTGIIARTGTTSVTEALAHPVWREDTTFTAVLAVLVLVSAFTKSAQFPFHSWLPDAMAAATPVSAYLHAAAVVKAGIFLMMRFSPAFHETAVWNYTLVSVGLFTSVMGGWFALQKTDLKKLMAYSTVSQLGLITAAIGVGTDGALTAAVVHTIAHALFKSGLFMMVGVVDHAAHTRDIRRLPALRRVMPWSFAVTVLGCASMAGVPPMLGFVSKEAVLTAVGQAPGVAWFAPAALVVTAVGAVVTFAYCAKIVFGAFVDGPEPEDVREAPPLLLVPAALPIVAGLPLALVVGSLDTPVARAVQAAVPGTPDVHLTLWHGFTPELAISLAVYAVGTLVVLNRARLRPRVERDLLPVDGAEVIARMVTALTRAGRLLAQPVRADHPTAQLVAMYAMLTALVLGGTFAVANGTGLPPQAGDLSRPIDAFLLVVVSVAVLALCLSDSRIGATVALSTVGIAVTVQLFSLGAPDVGLTQLLVESLTVIFIMLVLQKLPRTFGRPPRRRAGSALVLALLAGGATTVAVWALTGRRERTELARYYVEEGPVETGGSNVVNTILVEFRALDTLGELTVLGMAGVAIIAVLSTIRDRYLDPDPEHDPSYLAPPAVPVRPPGTRAHAALEEPWANAVPLKLLLRLVLPLMAGISAILFWRGHNEPGGGFIAALVASVVVGLTYLSTARDRQIGPPRLPLLLIGLGVLTAVGTGVWGLLAAGSFLQPLHGEVLGQNLSSAMVFDLGVFLAVLGLVMVACNLLGTSDASRAGERTRERADETVEGELTGPLDTVRGERPRLSVRSTALADGAPPQEAGR